MNDIFGPYRLLKTLAARNQSWIDLVENTAFANRREVLKRIPVIPENQDNRDLIEAEKQGAALQRLAHQRNPHIIDVYASGLLDGYFFVSMEYVEGTNLEEYQREHNGPLAPLQAASIACEVCSQVATLHEFLLTIDGKSQAFLHNDIKPSNIQMRKADNQIRLIDFGAAKAVTYSKNFTRNDFASIAYCSPERLDKGLSNTQTDLWSIGVVLYEMVAGRLPFQASTHQQLETLIRSGAPPARLPQTCPVALQSMVYKALSPAVEDRYPTAVAFAQDLQDFCSKPQLQVAAYEARTTGNQPPCALPPPASTKAAVENPTRRVAPIFSKAPQSGSNPGAMPFTTAPASYPPAAARPVRQVPRPISSIGRAIARKPLGFTFRTAVVVLALYVTLAGCSAHRQAKAFYASIETQDFPSLSLAIIDAETARLHALRGSTFGSFFAAISGLRSAIKPKLMEVAERPINAYRTEQDRTPATADWLRARSCLNFATEIDSSDKLARAELDLVDGHLAIVRKQWVDARQKFVEASSLASDSPDPWIALASLDAYQAHNLQALLDDQNKEQQRRYTLAEREAAQRGDLFTYLARKALGTAAVWRRKNSVEEESRFLREADNYFDRAQKSYEGCRGWFHTENAIEQIHKQRDAIQQRLAELTGGSQ